MQRRARLFETPEIAGGDLLFALKEITYSPEAPRMKQPFTVRGKVELLKIPFLAPIWVTVKVTYPERWWEEIIPIWGSPTVSETDMVIGSDFEITFPRGFDREGEFLLAVEVYAGPTVAVDKMMLPPFPPVTKEETTFLIAGEVPPEEEVGFRNFRILSYSKNGGPPVTPPGMLELDMGDRCRVNVGFDHRDGAVSGKFHAAIWQERPWDPHDEILNAEKSFTAPSSPDWQPFEDYYIDIPITSAISPGTYGLYVKIMGITGGDIFTEYLPDVIKIVGVPPEEADIKDFDFKLTKGTYDMEASVPFSAPYDYKGMAQDGQMIISIGTGVYPSFDPVYVYKPIAVQFPAAADWERRGLEGTIALPAVLEPGQTYSTRAKLETLTIETQETDTDWSAFDITAIETKTLEIDVTPPGTGYVTTSPAPIDIENRWTGDTRGKFEVGTRVQVTAHPHSGYRFDHWSDEIQGGVSYNNREWVSDNGYMYDNKAVKAHFREEAPTPPGLRPPEVETLEAADIIHDSAILRGLLHDTGYWSNVDVYFQWGETTAYGGTTPKVRMYSGQVGAVFFTELQHHLTPATTYHFRAVVLAVGYRSEEIGPQYGQDMVFTTQTEVVKGFTMRVQNARVGSVYWRAAYVEDAAFPWMRTSQSLSYVWEWTGLVPDYPRPFFVWSGDGALKTTQYDEFPFQVRAGKNYVWDFAAHQMREA